MDKCLVLLFWCSGTSKRFRNRKKIRKRRLFLLNARFEAWKSETPNRQQTECPLTNRFSYRGQKNLELNSRSYAKWTFRPIDLPVDWLSHLALAIYMFVVANFDALAQTSDFRIDSRQVVFLCWMRDSKLGSLRHQNRQQKWISDFISHFTRHVVTCQCWDRC